MIRIHKNPTSITSLVFGIIIIITLSFPGSRYLLTHSVLKNQENYTIHANTVNTTTIVSPLNYTTTFNSIGMELFFTGDGNRNAAVSVQFKKSSDSTWRNALPLWETNDGSTTPGPAFYGSAVELNAGTSYDVELTITDSDGVTSPSSVNSSNTNISVTNLSSNTTLTQVNSTTVTITTTGIVTRADTISSASSLTPTYFVRTDGSDNNNGTSNSSSGAWATLAKALSSAPSGAIVQVGPGHFSITRGTDRTSPITLIAQYPAVNDSRIPINLGLHTIIDSGLVTGPSNATETDVVKSPWIQVFPDNNNAHPVWKWTGGSSVSNITDQVGYAVSMDSEPNRIGEWKTDSSLLATATGWASLLYTNLTYNYGFYVDPNDPTSLYLRLPGDANPNNYYVFAGGTRGNIGDGFFFDGANMRVSGMEMREFTQAIVYSQNSIAGIVDHCLFEGDQLAVAFSAAAGPPSISGSDHVVEYNLDRDTNLWTTNTTSGIGIPWDFIKTYVKKSDGTLYTGTDKIGQSSENSLGSYHGAKRAVFRYNTVDGLHDGINGVYNPGFDRYSAQDNDVYGNVIEHLQDDAVEPGENTINWRIWDNISLYTGTCISINDDLFGPVYYFRNQCYRVGVDGLPVDQQGYTQPGGVGFKYSGDPGVPAMFYIINNIVYSDTGSVPGGGMYGGGVNSSVGYFYLRNNIFNMSSYGFAYPAGASFPSGHWNEDYDYFYSSDTSKPMEPYGGPPDTTVSGYRTTSAQGVHTNVSDTSQNFSTLPGLINPANNPPELNLASNSSIIDSGVLIPNIADQQGVNYFGTNPDIGAVETGSGLGITTNNIPSTSYSSTLSLTGTKDTTVNNILVNGMSATFPISSEWTDTANLNIGDNNILINSMDNSGNIAGSYIANVNRHKQGDINGDGKVDLTDLSIFAKDWHRGSSYGNTLYNPMSDQNGDGNVDLTDLSMFAKSWGS